MCEYTPANTFYSFSKYEIYKAYKQLKRPSRTLKVIDVGAILQTTHIYDFLLMSHCNHVSILHHFQDIISYLQKLRESHDLNTPPFGALHRELFDDQLSNFDRQTDGQTDERTDRIAISLSCSAWVRYAGVRQ